ncbi:MULTISPECIES: hypothetical protein [Sphingomonas]|uniref:hypothetical protein n=1 Tax=Sphingomonas TaxID=13687 RepID=UPI000DEF1CA9|nr:MULTISPECIES: hypothetical protein [Sphingomonas]
MMKTLIVLGAASVALGALPAEARTYSNTVACSGWRDGQCVAWNRLTNKQVRDIAVGTEFGANYSYYTPYDQIPQAVVTQYHLAPTNRYVTAEGYTYVVDPSTYKVTQVITPTTTTTTTTQVQPTGTAVPPPPPGQ